MTVTETVPTSYAGCRFRSRLEARWAVFLTTAGIRWDYEPRVLAIHIPRRHRVFPYLPDFWLPAAGQYAEAKGFLFNDGFRRLLDIANGLKHDLVVLGHIPGPFDARWPIQLHRHDGGLLAVPWRPEPGPARLSRAIREEHLTPGLLLTGFPRVCPEWAEPALDTARSWRFPPTAGPAALR